MRRAGTDPVKRPGDERKDPKHGKAFQGKKNPATGPGLDPGENFQVVAQQADIDQITGRGHFARIKAVFEATVHGSSSTVQGRP